MRGFVIVTLLVLGLWTRAAAQASFQLPADLYVLTQDGRIERYAPGQIGAAVLTPAEAFILDFGVDAAGERLAYRTESGLYLLLLDLPDLPPIQLEGPSADVPPYRGRGDTIVWSPTGDALAYTTLNGMRVYFDAGAQFVELTDAIFLSLTWSPGGSYLAAEGENNVWWVYRRELADGVSTLTLTAILPSAIGAAFVSDPELIFAPADGGLRLLNLAAANAQTLILDASTQYSYPTLTADDRLAFFARPLADATIAPGTGILQTLARGAREVVTAGQRPLSLAGLRWTPDGGWLIAFQGGVLGLIDPRTGDGVPFSVSHAAAYAWGPLHGDGPGLDLAATAAPMPTLDLTPAAQSTLLAANLPITSTAPPAVAGTLTDQLLTPTPTFEPLEGRALPAALFFSAPDANGIVQVWRINPATGAAAAFTEATSDVSNFTSTPNGSAVAYSADGTLWVQRLTVRQPIRIARLTTFAPPMPSLRADGAYVAYVDHSTETGGIWVAAPDGSPPVRLLANRTTGPIADQRSFRSGRWSPTGDRLLVEAARPDGGLGIGVVTFPGGAYTEALPTSPDDVRGAFARWLPAGRILSLRDGDNPGSEDFGFYLYDGTALGTTPVQWIPLPATALVRDAWGFTAGQFRALLADLNYPDALLRVVDVSGTTITDVLVLPPLAVPLLERTTGLFVSGLLDGVPVIVDLSTGAIFTLPAANARSAPRWAGQ